MAKVDRIVDLLEARIARGDYALTAFPPEVRLADENGVSRMTARKAVLQLISNGLLERDELGRLVVTKERMPSRPLHVGFFTTTFNSSTSRWRHATEQVVHSHQGFVRSVTFYHWDDPILLEAIEKFDGILLGPPAETMPPELARRLQSGRARVAIRGADYTHLGFPSVNLVPITSISILLDHLEDLGHRRIAAFNTQPVDSVIQERLSQWESWLKERGLTGEQLNRPEVSYGEPMERAYVEAKAWLASGKMQDTAVFCLTLPAAIGLMRAMGEAGLVPGRDISICSANDEALGRYLYPSVTSIIMPDPQPLLEDCVSWMAGAPWQGPLLRQPDHPQLFIGDSTGVPAGARSTNSTAAFAARPTPTVN